MRARVSPARWATAARLLVVLLAVAGWSLVSPVSSLAALHWSAAQYADTPPTNQSVSCVSATYCVALNWKPNDDGVVSFNGQRWSPPVTIDPRHAPDGISCPTRRFCAMVDAEGYAMTFNGHRWGEPKLIDRNSSQALGPVSCASPSFCVAVDGDGNAYTFNGLTWSGARRIANPVDLLVGISCPSRRFCVAVGEYGALTTFNGRSWSRARSIVRNFPSYLSMVDLSCGSASLCVAASDETEAFTYNGHRWKLMQVDLPGDFASVSCPSASFCAAVGGTDQDLVTFDGTSWTRAVDVDRPREMADVSCASASFCVATDTDGYALTGTS